MAAAARHWTRTPPASGPVDTHAMKLRERVWPYLYSAMHAHELCFELMQSANERRIAQNDAARLCRLLPVLNGYGRLADKCRRDLESSYHDYTSRISPGAIAISLELATFLAVICSVTHPPRVLDLGSGFSSFVFRTYKKRQPRALVWSVDDSPAWLERTRAFLQEYQLDCRDLFTWETFLAMPDKPPFDLILQDMSDLGTRRERLGATIEACGKNGLIVLDDAHVPQYRRSLRHALEQRGLNYYSLRQFTKKKLRYAGLATALTSSGDGALSRENSSRTDCVS